MSTKKKSKQEQTIPQSQANPKPEQKLSQRQFFFMIIQTQIGVGVLSVPHELHNAAKQDGWISLIIAAILIQIVVFVIWLTARNHPEDNLFQINELIFSKWIGKGLSFLYVLYFLAVGTLIILLYGRMISVWVLPNTPLWVLSLLMILICGYLVAGGLLVVARLYTMLSFLLIILIALVIYSMKEMNLMYILPVFEEGVGRVLKGVDKAVLSFFGFIVSLVIFPKVEGTPKQRLKTMVKAHWFVTGFYLFTVFASFTFFSSMELTTIPEPLLYMLKSFELPIIARIDLFFISIWIISVATSFATYIYMGSLGLKHTFMKKGNVRHIVSISIVIFVITMYMGFDITKVETFNKWVVYAGYFFSLMLPFIMLPFSYLAKKRKKGKG
ncbi:endospore germination permease [Halobacillus sp. ACCC02827]|uniref:GerAB/ArcD/ProY family transporter n=1 Tax=Halobacillus sp. ACCC02827 TaxID=3052090 RepID=UPI0025708F7C|nr:endospore germination permease [Halobacillus sp. ACCC02827]WJE16703.1 endospore germination permease [Halobacillus sp. ACCC02827]